MHEDLGVFVVATRIWNAIQNHDKSLVTGASTLPSPIV